MGISTERMAVGAEMELNKTLRTGSNGAVGAGSVVEAEPCCVIGLAKPVKVVVVIALALEAGVGNAALVEAARCEVSGRGSRFSIAGVGVKSEVGVSKGEGRGRLMLEVASVPVAGDGC